MCNKHQMVIKELAMDSWASILIWLITRNEFGMPVPKIVTEIFGEHFKDHDVLYIDLSYTATKHISLYYILLADQPELLCCYRILVHIRCISVKWTYIYIYGSTVEIIAWIMNSSCTNSIQFSIQTSRLFLFNSFTKVKHCVTWSFEHRERSKQLNYP